MLKGCLVYDKEGAGLNGFFINRLCEQAQSLSLELVPVIFEGDLSVLSGYDYAICRTRDHKINEYFEKMGVRVFNNSRTNFVANDKWATFELANRLGIDVMPTVRAENEDLGKMKYPCVIKSRSGHGGKEVFMAHSQEEAFDILGNVKKPCIAQMLCDTPGVDVRVYCVGGGIVAAVKREAVSGFKSNFSLGGRAIKVEPTKKQEEIINKLYNELKFDFVGVDFIFHNGEWVLNEIEDPVGSRMLYHSTDVDIAKVVMNYILQVMSCSATL